MTARINPSAVAKEEANRTKRTLTASQKVGQASDLYHEVWARRKGEESLEMIMLGAVLDGVRELLRHAPDAGA